MLSRETKLSLLTTALEGGSNYWYMLNDLSMVPDKGYEAKTPEALAESESMRDCLVFRIWEALDAGAEIPVSDIETGDLLGKLSKKSMNKAVGLMLKGYKKHFADALAENEDAETGDVFFQLAVMGDVVFG
jgi:hypothetical protein